MKFSCQIIINQPLERIVELWQNPDNNKYWQDGFERIEHLSGTPGEINAKSMLYFKNGQREMVLQETILKNDLPNEFIGLYEHSHMINTMSSRFSSVNDQSTLYEAEIEYTKFIGIIPKLMSILLPWVFKRQVQKWLKQFKEFAEAGSFNN